MITVLQTPATAGVEAADPALAVDPATGDLLFSWMEGDTSGYSIRFARSSDGGTTWSPAVTVTGPATDLKPHAESAPRLVAGPGAIAIVWSNSTSAPGRKWPGSNVRIARSTDAGRTWSAALTLNDDSSSSAGGGHLFHGAAWSGDSGLVVAWMDSRVEGRGAAGTRGRGEEANIAHEHADADAEPDATVFAAVSRDFGATWETRNRPLWGQACPCCRIALARDPLGGVRGAWRHHYPGNIRDIVVARIGQREPARVHVDGWEYPGCPHAGPGLMVDSSGVSHVGWYVGKEGSAGVFYARQSAAGTAESAAPVALVSGRTLPVAHVSVAARRGGGAYVGYDVNAEGRSVAALAVIDGTGRVTRQIALATEEGADHPQVAQVAGVVVVAWTQRGAKSRVAMVRVPE